jgi:hypothetical protein
MARLSSSTAGKKRAGRVETLFHAVYGRLIIDFHREPIETSPLAVANARVVAVPDVDSDVVVIVAAEASQANDADEEELLAAFSISFLNQHG